MASIAETRTKCLNHLSGLLSRLKHPLSQEELLDHVRTVEREAILKFPNADSEYVHELSKEFFRFKYTHLSDEEKLKETKSFSWRLPYLQTSIKTQKDKDLQSVIQTLSKSVMLSVQDYVDVSLQHIDDIIKLSPVQKLESVVGRILDQRELFVNEQSFISTSQFELL
ncbi:hypothetical protein RCL1_000193 [Eukaryota sp. TZLM3-RCL]